MLVCRSLADTATRTMCRMHSAHCHTPAAFCGPPTCVAAPAFSSGVPPPLAAVLCASSFLTCASSQALSPQCSCFEPLGKSSLLLQMLSDMLHRCAACVRHE